ncbi:hypothetical protein F5Y19DRAFT_403526 [Xylariaceae sp. FL1651]|nr:hypothetical protein F5Y19DRAFT_403526 [Xylariaceae sp. FL1651]
MVMYWPQLPTMKLLQAIVTLAIVFLGAVGAQGNPTAPSTCASGCVNGVFVNAANIGCANGDTLCVCGKTDSFHDGIRDCITAACAADVPDIQIPLADAYGDSLCASASSTATPPSPATTNPATAQPSDPTVIETASVTSLPTTAVTTTPSPSAEISSQSTTASTIETSLGPSSTASGIEATGILSSSLSISTSAFSSPTASDAPHPTSSSTPASSSGLSTPVKAGIGAGVGVAALVAAVIAVCLCLRNRQKKRKQLANRAPPLKISKPMTGSGRQYADDVRKADAGLSKTFPTTKSARADATVQPTSPTSVYSYASELESHARRYEDLLPRTQPRTMI